MVGGHRLQTTGQLTRAVERLADDEWVARSQARKAAIIETGVEETKDSESQSLHKLTDALATITASAENVAGGVRKSV